MINLAISSLALFGFVTFMVFWALTNGYVAGP